MEAVIAISVFLCVTALMMALFSRPANGIQRRLQTFREMVAVDESVDKDPPFADRVLRPVMHGALQVAKVVLPSTLATRLQWQLTLAGDPLSFVGLLVVWATCAVGLPLLYIFAVSVGGVFGQQQLLLLLLIAGVGGYLPYAWLKIKASQRKTKLLKTLPDAIDLLSTSVEAGLGVDAALGQVAEKVKGPIAVEFRRLLREMAMGSSRRDALQALANRTDIPDMKTFVNAVVQAEQTGVSLGHVIRVQADQMRMRRRQRAEQQAHKAPVKITIPLVLFIFPTMLVVILGPAAINISKGLGGK